MSSFTYLESPSSPVFVSLNDVEIHRQSNISRSHPGTDKSISAKFDNRLGAEELSTYHLISLHFLSIFPCVFDNGNSQYSEKSKKSKRLLPPAGAPITGTKAPL